MVHCSHGNARDQRPTVREERGVGRGAADWCPELSALHSTGNWSNSHGGNYVRGNITLACKAHFVPPCLASWDALDTGKKKRRTYLGRREVQVEVKHREVREYGLDQGRPRHLAVGKHGQHLQRSGGTQCQPKCEVKCCSRNRERSPHRCCSESTHTAHRRRGQRTAHRHTPAHAHTNTQRHYHSPVQPHTRTHTHGAVLGSSRHQWTGRQGGSASETGCSQPSTSRWLPQ